MKEFIEFIKNFIRCKKEFKEINEALENNPADINLNNLYNTYKNYLNDSYLILKCIFVVIFSVFIVLLLFLI